MTSTYSLLSIMSIYMYMMRVYCKYMYQFKSIILQHRLEWCRCRHLPSSVKMMLLLSATRPPNPHRVNANSDINVTDEINNNSLASNLEPAIRTIFATFGTRNIFSILSDAGCYYMSHYLDRWKHISGVACIYLNV